MDNNLKILFENIYSNNIWSIYGNNLESRSGYGSTIKAARPYIDFLISFIKYNNINSILDLGCGDFNLMSHILKNYPKIKYIGIDIVANIIKENQIKYQNDNIEFLCNDISEYKIYNTTNFDLIIIKDTLQHLDNTTILKILTNILSINNNIVILFINDYDNNIINNDSFYRSSHQSRPIDLYKAPFNVYGSHIQIWNDGYSTKSIFLKQLFKH